MGHSGGSSVKSGIRLATTDGEHLVHPSVPPVGALEQATWRKGKKTNATAAGSGKTSGEKLLRRMVCHDWKAPEQRGNLATEIESDSVGILLSHSRGKPRGGWGDVVV